MFLIYCFSAGVCNHWVCKDSAWQGFCWKSTSQPSSAVSRLKWLVHFIYKTKIKYQFHLGYKVVVCYRFINVQLSKLSKIIPLKSVKSFPFTLLCWKLSLKKMLVPYQVELDQVWLLAIRINLDIVNSKPSFSHDIF